MLETNQQVIHNLSPIFDIFDGCSIPAAYADAYRRGEKSLKSAKQVMGESVSQLVKAQKNAASITIINPLGFKRTEPVTVSLPAQAKCLMDEDGNVIAIQKKGKEFVFVAQGIPALSQKAYKILTSMPKKANFAAIESKTTNYGGSFDSNPNSSALGYYDIDTPLAHIRINRNSGAIGSYFDKRLERELVDYGVPRPVQHASSARLELALNVFQIIDEAPNGMSAWLINKIRKEENLLDGAEVTQVASGPVFIQFRVVHKFRSSRIEEDILIYRESPRVDFEATIDWQEKGADKASIPQLKVAFGTSMSAARFKTEGPFIITERPADGQEVPSQKWAGLAGDEFGFAIFNDCKYGCDALGSRLRLTLLRNSYTPSPDSDGGEHTMRFAFEPYAAGTGNAEVVRKAMAFNRPCVGAVGQSKASGNPGLFEISGTDSVVCTAFRLAEHSDGYLLRLFETSGKPCQATIAFGQPVRSLREVNLLENPVSDAMSAKNGKAELRFRKFEIKTLLLELKG